MAKLEGFPFRNRDSSLVVDAELAKLGRRHGDADYAEQQAALDYEFLAERLVQLGFIGHQRVLDVGCGFGQWTLALSLLNESASGFDPSPTRIQIAQELAGGLGPNGSANFKLDSLETAEFTEGHFDAIFCFGVFMFLNPETAMERFKYWLRPGGLLYICTNSYGWWMYLLLFRGLLNPAIARNALRALIFGARKLPTAFSTRALKRIMEEHGFSSVRVAREGELNRGKKRMGTYISHFLGLNVTIEALALAPSAENPKREETREERIGHKVQTPHPSNLREIDGPSIQLSILDGMLKRTIQVFPAGLEIMPMPKTLGEFESLLVKAHQGIGHGIFHDIHRQPLKTNGAVPNSPTLNTALGVGRCGVKARVLADYLVSCEIESGVLITGSHVLTWASFQDTTYLLDCDNYAPGVIPRNEFGRFPVAEDYESNAHFLDGFLSSLHLAMPQNLERSRPSQVPISSTIANSPGGRWDFYRRVGHADVFSHSLAQPSRRVQFANFPPFLRSEKDRLPTLGAGSKDPLWVIAREGLELPRLEESSIDQVFRLQDFQRVEVLKADSLTRRPLGFSAPILGLVFESQLSLAPFTCVPLDSTCRPWG